MRTDQVFSCSRSLEERVEVSLVQFSLFLGVCNNFGLWFQRLVWDGGFWQESGYGWVCDVGELLFCWAKVGSSEGDVDAEEDTAMECKPELSSFFGGEDHGRAAG